MSTLSVPKVWIWQPTLYVFGALLALRLGSSATATLSFALLAAYAFTGRRQAIHALLLSWLFVMLNPAIAPPPSATSLLRYLVLFSAAASVFLRSELLHGRARISPLGALTCLLGLFIVVHSMLISPEPMISVLKGISWTMAIMTSLAAWGGLSPEERTKTAKEIFVVFLFVALASVALLSIPSAYMRTSTPLFRGLLGHSQALGPMLAILVAWIIALLLQNFSWIRIAILATILPLIFFTGARTAMLASFLGIAFASVLAPLLLRQQFLAVMPVLKNNKLFIVFVMSLSLAIIWIDPIVVSVDNFLNKGRQYDSVLAAYEDSRGGLIDVMLANIREQPMMGIGFGIASDPTTMEVQRVAGIPVSAVVEKGVTPIAILEELGIPGASLAAIWVWALIVRSARAGLGPLACLGTIIALNFGEATLFSPGGMGMLSIVMIGWIVSTACIRPSWRTTV